MLLKINEAADRLINLKIHDMNSNIEYSHTELKAAYFIKQGVELRKFLSRKDISRTRIDKKLEAAVYDAAGSPVPAYEMYLRVTNEALSIETGDFILDDIHSAALQTTTGTETLRHGTIFNKHNAKKSTESSEKVVKGFIETLIKYPDLTYHIDVTPYVESDDPADTPYVESDDPADTPYVESDDPADTTDDASGASYPKYMMVRIGYIITDYVSTQYNYSIKFVLSNGLSPPFDVQKSHRENLDN